MKKVLIVAAAAGLMSVAACTPAATNNTAAENAVESHEDNAEMLSDMADNATTPAAENALDNAAAVEENKAEAAEGAM